MNGRIWRCLEQGSLAPIGLTQEHCLVWVSTSRQGLTGMEGLNPTTAREWIWAIDSWLGERKEAHENIIGLVTLCFHLRRPQEVPARLRTQDSACT